MPKSHTGKKKASTDDDGRRNRQRTSVNDRAASNVPEIPGVPPDVTPHLVKAIQQTTKAFHSCDDTLIDPFAMIPELTTSEGETNRHPTGGRSSRNPLDEILKRVENATTDRSESEKRRGRIERLVHSQQSFLDALDRSESNNRHRTRKKRDEDETTDDGTDDSRHSRSVALEALLYVWNLQEHDRSAVRRATLNLSAKLLRRHPDCRNHWREQLLLNWLWHVVDSRGGGDNQNSEQTRTLSSSSSPSSAAAQAHVMWQVEASQILEFFADEFDDESAQYIVGLRFLQQKCPNVSNVRDVADSSTTSVAFMSSSTMEEIRSIRDFALRNSDKLIAIVRKSIRRAHSCMDTLMPRIGMEERNSLSVPVPTTPVAGDDHTPDDDNNDDDDDEDDINWEEGDELHAALAHAEAVEQTLAVMQSTGGLRGGDFQVDMVASSSQERQLGDARGGTSRADGRRGGELGMEAVTRRLKKTVRSLRDRHLKQISSWVYALTNADNLTPAENGACSLVAMSNESIQRRRELHGQLLELKTDVSSVLSAAARLDILHGERTGTTSEGDQHTSPNDCTNQPRINGALRNLTQIPRRHDTLARAIAKRPRPGGNALRRSNKIQIKYRKT